MSLSRALDSQSTPPAGPWVGFCQPFLALGLLRCEPRLLRWVWWPALINTLGLLAAAGIAWAGSRRLELGAAGELLDVPLWLLGAAASQILLLLGGVLLYLLVTLPLAAPFTAPLAEQIRLASRGVIDAGGPGRQQLRRQAPARLRAQLRLLLPLLSLQLALAAVALLPAVGAVAATVLQLTVGLPLTLLLIGWMLVACALQPLPQGGRERLRLLALRRGELVGLGTAQVVLLLLPGLNLLALPAAVAGGALLVERWAAPAERQPSG